MRNRVFLQPLKTGGQDQIALLFFLGITGV